jgi:DNA (cytosine-5)-methyltransferase 1
MLDEGLRTGFEYFGIGYRTVAYVEREAYAAASLVARMEDGALDQAPVWSDLTTFDSAAWRGKLDCVTAGFPCQPHSVAGKRKGLDDDRWIWPNIVDIIRASGAWLIWLENVTGLVSTGGLAACLEDLSALGFNAEWGVLSAGEVGASHRRERLFILAHRHSERIDREKVDESRADQLRAIGNGVVPLQAAAAFVLLARRAGIFEGGVT